MCGGCCGGGCVGGGGGGGVRVWDRVGWWVGGVVIE